MWLATQHGFCSLVEKKPNEFHLRARCREDLENLVALTGLDTPIVATPSGDYAWRIIVDKPTTLKVLVDLGDAIDYSNFKDRIHDLPDQRNKAPIYSRLWSQLYAFQAHPPPP